MRELAVSFLLHAIVISLLAFNAKPLSQVAPTPQATKVEVVEAVKKHAKDDRRQIAAIAPGGQKPCEHFYGGIGIYAGFNTPGMTTVDRVMAGYAAESAGLMPGDVIIDGMSTPLIGEIGEDIVLIVVRGSSTLTFHMKRSKVCVD